uniref:Uncharacterized protein n=1 Tax=Setaria viridis TaxID=4556 RepID=A0A4U6TPT7_SETVI|nr:hypothetical protein SEVIR_7G138200v2 [Setaria viridis]
MPWKILMPWHRHLPAVLAEPHARAGLRIFYHVRIYLDGIPSHAWTPDMCINTNLVQSLDTRHIDLWAWTANSSDIPKRVWLVFTHRPSDRSTIAVMQEQSDRWQQGICYEVFIHVDLVEDYTAAAHDLHGVISNPAAFKPVKRPYIWRYGLVDGALVDAQAKFPVCLPLLPHEPANHERGRDAGQRDRRREEIRHRDALESSKRRDEERRHDVVERGRGASHKEESRRTEGRTCREDAFIWLG